MDFEEQLTPEEEEELQEIVNKRVQNLMQEQAKERNQNLVLRIVQILIVIFFIVGFIQWANRPASDIDCDPVQTERGMQC